MSGPDLSAGFLSRKFSQVTTGGLAVLGFLGVLGVLGVKVLGEVRA